MIHNIYVYGSPVLRRTAEAVPRDYPELKTLAEDMFQTMRASNGVGLAAPQIGLPITMFVVDLTMCDPEDYPEYQDFRKVFVNPEIYWEGDDEVSMEEGCLSLPGINEEVWRTEKIRVRWLDENFEPHDEEFDDYAARVIQHEYDHLLGKVFTDRITPVRRTMLRGRLKDMSKGKYNAAYKTKISG